MNGIRFTYIKIVYLFHQNESGRKELCKWKKFCEWCNGKKTHAHTNNTFHFISFISTELDLLWGNHMIQNENKTTCDKWVQKNNNRNCHVAIAKMEAKWCEQNVYVRSFTVARLYVIIVAIEIRQHAYASFEFIYDSEACLNECFCKKIRISHWFK